MLDKNVNETEEEILDSLIYKEIDEKFTFTVFRNNQKETIYKIVKSFMNGKKFFIVEAPTGAGKSIIGVTALKVISSMFPEMIKNEKDGTYLLKNYNSVVCTKTKALQTQYTSSFNDIPTLYSAPGYKCNREPYNPDSYYGSHLCNKKACSFYNKCDYRIAQKEFLSSEIGVLNYAFFQHFVDHPVGLLALDEAHNLEKVLCDHLHIRFNLNNIRKALDKMYLYDLCSEGSFNTVVDCLSDILNVYDTDDEWFKEILKLCNRMISNLYATCKNFNETKKLIDDNKIYHEETSDNVEARKNILHYGKQIVTFKNKLYKLVHSRVEWVISERKDGDFIDLKPVSLSEEANTMFSRARFSILMSATISGIPEFCKNLGINENEYDSVSLDSMVPVERRKVYPLGLPGFSMKTRNEVLPTYLSVTDNIIDQFGKVRGLIHTVSYENAQYIKDNSKHKKRMIIPKKEDLMDVKKLLDRKKDAILVTPAMTEGSDLSDDYCRFLIFFKIPSPFLGDKWISRKKDISQEWYATETINALIQGSGRGVRSETDECLTFILDGNMKYLLKYKHLFPKWYLKAISYK